MRFFLAGIIQGSLVEAAVHNQDYRGRIKRLLSTHFPGADIYDPVDNHAQSIDYDEQTGRRVFFHHLQLCRQVDVLVAFLPEASMGTAIEMWEAYQNGVAVITISPMVHNWVVRFLSHQVYENMDQLAAEVESGRLAERIAQVRGRR